MSVLVIAEIGCNHQGNVVTALDMAYEAKEAGADIAKFQLFKDRPEIEHLRFSEDDILIMHERCHDLGIEFACTPFYLDAVKFLNPLVSRHKIASGWTKKRKIFDAAVATGKPVIASMGMTTSIPHASRDVYLLHCVSLYPCPDKKADLFKVRRFAGYSDHTVGTVACIAAVALGATIIEKHFTLDKTQTGPDHSCSAEPHEFAEMVRQIRRVEEML